MGDEKARWVPDDERSCCVVCESKFSLVKRRHHCRVCGEVTCANCLENIWIPDYEKPQPVCAKCRLPQNFGDRKQTDTRQTITEALLQVQGLTGKVVPTPKENNRAGYLTRREGSSKLAKKGQTSWRRRFFCFVDEIGVGFSGPGLLCYERRPQSDSSSAPLEVIPLAGAVVYCYERHNFPRVKDAYHFGVKPRGKEDPVILEAENQSDRVKWLAALMSKSGVVDGGMIKPPRYSDRTVKEGWLEKLGKVEKASGMHGGWKTRYFVLDGNPNRMDYYGTWEEVEKRKPLGTIPLDPETTVSVIPAKFLGLDACISLTPAGGRRFVVSCADEREQSEWLQAIEHIRQITDTETINKRKEANDRLMEKALQAQKEAEERAQQLADAESRAKQREEEQKRREDEFHQKVTDLGQEKDSIKQLQEALEEERQRLVRELEAERRKLMTEIRKEEDQLLEERKLLDSQTETVRKESVRIKTMLRIARKERQQLKAEQEEFTRSRKNHEIEAKKVAELWALIQQDSRQRANIDEELRARELQLMQREADITRREGERSRKDQLLDEFRHVLNG